MKNTIRIFSCRKFISLSFSFEINSINLQTLFDDSPLVTGNTRSQDQKTYYHPDGSIYIFSVSSLEQNNSSIYHNARPYILDNKNYIDINNESDLLLAQSFDSKVITK